MATLDIYYHLGCSNTLSSVCHQTKKDPVALMDPETLCRGGSWCLGEDKRALQAASTTEGNHLGGCSAGAAGMPFPDHALLTGRKRGETA